MQGSAVVRKWVAGLIALALGLTGILVLPSAARAEAGVGPWVLREAANLQLWQSVAYGAGLFVAVSADGDDQVMTSANGTTWTARSTPLNDTDWESITYGGGLFVVVSMTGEVMYSADGISWTLGTAPSEPWSSVSYGGGTFVAVGSADYVITSTDGQTWAAGGSVEDTSWRSVTYGEGTFVAVSDFAASGQVITSVDGSTWTDAATQPDVSEWVAVTYGEGRFVAVACVCDPSQTEVAYSDDGQTWTSIDAPSSEWSSVTYGDDRFVAVAQDGGVDDTDQVMTSADGITWALSDATPENYWTGVAFGGGVFAAVALTNTTEQVMISYTPTVSSVSPASGPLVGGTSVTITGTFLTGATAVTFGGAAATFTVDSPTQITATIPAHAAGQVNVVVTTPGGAATGTGSFRYIPAPTIATVSPGSGSTAGGSTVIITGNNLITTTGVTFGGVAAASFTVDTGGAAATVIATTPAHAAGVVNVEVTSPSGTATSSGAFVFVVPPAPTPTPTPSPPPSPTPTPAPMPAPVVPVLGQESLLVRFTGQSSRVTVAQRDRIEAFVDAQPGVIVSTRIVGFPAESTRAARVLARERADATAEALEEAGVTVTRGPGRLMGTGDIETFPGRAGRVFVTLWTVS